MRGRRSFGLWRIFRLGRGQRRVGLGLGLGLLMLAGPGLDTVSLAWRNSEGCRVWAVTDGDTVQAWCGISGPRSVRLLGFDTPELRGRCVSETLRAMAATYRLRWALWTSRETQLVMTGRDDRYGRALARLTVDGRDAGRMLMQAGLARAYTGGKRFGWCGEAV